MSLKEITVGHEYDKSKIILRCSNINFIEMYIFYKVAFTK